MTVEPVYYSSILTFTELNFYPLVKFYAISMYIVTFAYISNLATVYIQKRRGEPGLFSFEYNLSPKLILK